MEKAIVEDEDDEDEEQIEPVPIVQEGVAKVTAT